MTAPDRTDDGEPRFAGSVPAGGWPQHEPPAWPDRPPPAEMQQAMRWPSEAPPVAPSVTYGPGFAPAEPAGSVAARRLGPVALVAGGGALMALATFFTWASLRFASSGTDSQTFSDPPNIRYDGFSLLEGRVLLGLGLGSIVLSGLCLMRRGFTRLLTTVGAVSVVTVAFAALGHPVELATLFRSYQQLDTVKVTLPAGVGMWLALAGAVLVLVGGLLAHYWREPFINGQQLNGPDQPTTGNPNDRQLTENGGRDDRNFGR